MGTGFGVKNIFEIYQEHKDPISKIIEKSGNDLWAEHMEEKKKKKSKYRNEWVVIDKIKFQSVGEGNYYMELKSKLLRGEISGFKRQIPFELVVNGIRVGKYVADFAILYFDGSIEVVDWKSRFTIGLALYQMKKALMLAIYNIIIKEIGNK